VARLPVISGDEAIKAFQKAGWEVRRQVGSHVMLDKDGEVATLSVPRHRDLGPGLLRRLIKDAGMTVEEFVGLMRRL
jgi:predicted RNA binding protein YcfA (HicA-like mRNA interferase family)